MKNKAFLVRVSPDSFAKLNELAAALRVSRNHVMRELVHLGVTRDLAILKRLDLGSVGARTETTQIIVPKELLEELAALLPEEPKKAAGQAHANGKGGRELLTRDEQ